MIYQNYTPQDNNFQLMLPGFDALPLGYPIRGILRCLALCTIYGWPHLGSLANRQLARALGERGRR